MSGVSRLQLNGVKELEMEKLENLGIKGIEGTSMTVDYM